MKEVDFILIKLNFLALADFIQDHLANDIILFISELIHQIIEPLKVFVTWDIPVEEAPDAIVSSLR